MVRIFVRDCNLKLSVTVELSVCEVFRGCGFV